MTRTPPDPSWTCSHFSLANPVGRDQGNLPKLLRRLATAIDQLPDRSMVLDVTFSSDMTAEGPWFSATVYYSPEGWLEA